MNHAQLAIRPACEQDKEALQAIRAAAFAPVFASFRKILGATIYEAAQAHEDNDQARYLDSLFDDADWQLFVAELAGEQVGFVSVKLDEEHGSGEIGLNAIAPEFSGRGFGTAIYEFALSVMRDAGMRVATVATGGDPSHAPARRAYEKAGFNVTIPSLWMCRTL